MNNLTAYLPPWFQKVQDFNALCTSESGQFETLAQEMDSINQNFFFQTMDLQSVALWEPLFGIVPNQLTETIEFRRARLLNRISNRPPFTLPFLREKLDELIGKNAYTVYVDYPSYTLYIESSARDQSWQEEIWVTIQTVKPCHIVYINKPYLAGTITMSEEVSLADVISNYRLGAWRLGEKPFATVLPKGVIVTAAQRSIQEALLKQTASFVAGDVASVRLNGSIFVTGITRKTDGGKATISYIVTPTDTALVTQEALLDFNGVVLTSSPVYVPVATTTQFTHVFTVKEEA